MPRKNRKCKKKMNQLERGETASESKASRSGDQQLLQAKEIEKVATFLKLDDLGEVPLIISLAILQKPDAISQVLKQGCNIDELGPNRTTALMWCVRNRNLSLAQFLLAQGADSSIEDENGNNILFQVLEDCAWSEIAFLTLWDSILKTTKRIDLNHTNKLGTTLMHLAVKREWVQAVIVLVEEKANVNVIDSNAATPLMLAAFRYNQRILEILLQSGADAFCRDKRGRTALCYAISTTIAKSLQPPFTIIDLLLTEMVTKGCTIKDYLKYVIDCSSIETLTHIIVFTLRHIPDGVKILLQIDFFRVMLKSYQKHQNLYEQKALLIIVTEVLSHDVDAEIGESFCKSEWPDTCLEILKTDSESQSDAEALLKAAAMHLLILFCGDTEEGTNFLKTNLEIVLKNYDRSLENYLLQKYEYDDLRNQNVYHKIKSFKEQLQKMKSETAIYQDDSSDANYDNQEDTTLVTAIKVGVQKLQEELERDGCKKENSKGNEMEYKELYRQRMQKYTSPQTVDFVINYLDEILQKIVAMYQSQWKINSDTEKIHEEMFQIQRLQERFKSLTVTIKDCAHRNLEAAQMTLDHLETLLLQHKIRGKTIAESISMNDYLNTSSYFEETGDQLYFKEISLLSEKKQTDQNLQKEAQAKTMENKYHLIPSIMAICDDDEDEDFEDVKACERKVILKSSMGSMSRWCSLLQKLHSVAHCEQLLGGDIRVCSREKNKVNYIISTSGNFNPVEIGLDVNSRPLAIKRIPKATKVCRSLKLLINPLLGLRHTHILHYFACDYEDNDLILATPLCEYNIGEYMMYIRQNTQIPVLSTSMVVCQFLSGLKFLHEFKEPIVHGNLKPSNIFVDLCGVVRIAEFGIHRALFQLNEAPASSTIWFARETYESFKKTATVECTIPSDIHVSGMLLHFILTGGKHPYGEEAGEILGNLEKATPQISTGDMDLQDLITWMLLYDPRERPTVSQVLSHVFFWSAEKRWSFILTCSGIGANTSNLNIEELHSSINSTARKDDIKGSWVVVVKQAFPKLTSIDDDDTPTGLLRFIKCCYDNQISIHINPIELSGYILGAFPALTLSLYRMLESTSWLRHPAFLPFIK